MDTIDIYVIYDFMFHTYATWFHHKESVLVSHSSEMSYSLHSCSFESENLTQRKVHSTEDTVERSRSLSRDPTIIEDSMLYTRQIQPDSLTKSYVIPTNVSIESIHSTSSSPYIQRSSESQETDNGIVMYLGRNDFEKLVIEMCYLKNKSRCSTLSNRMFDKVYCLSICDLNSIHTRYVFPKPLMVQLVFFSC